MAKYVIALTLAESVGWHYLSTKKLNFVVMRQHNDNEGRIPCVKAKINGIKINLCNIHASKMEEPELFHKGARGYIGWKHNHCMIQDGILDKTLPIGKIPKDRKDLGLVDIWRLVNPREKQRNITFFPKYFVIK